MRLQKQKTARSNKKPLVIVAIIILALAIVGVVYYFGFTDSGVSTGNTVPRNPTTVAPSKGGQQTSEPGTPTDDNVSEPADGKPPTEGTGNEPEGDAPSGTTLTITAANQNGNRLQVRTLISAVWEGTCDLNMTKDGITVTRSAPIQGLPNSATCQGFDVPVSELSPGEWNIEITAMQGEELIKSSRLVTIN